MRRKNSCLIVLLVACALLGVRQAKSQTGYTGKIAFTSFRENTVDIFVMNLADSSVVNLTHNTDLNYFPDWSPDGKRIVWQRQANIQSTPKNTHNQIWTMNADGSDAKIITNDPHGDYYFPTWLPDGKRIAAVSCYENNGGCDLTVMQPDGTHQINLTHRTKPSEDIGYFTMSPDGKQFLVLRGSEDTRGFYLMNSDGSNITLLLADTETEHFLSNPDWSPDGQTILFVSYSTSIDKSSEIKVMSKVGSHPKILLTINSISQRPKWSPDGKDIVFQSSELNNPNDQISVMNADGTNPVKVADGFGPAWVR